MLDSLVREDFAKCLGTNFEIEFTEGNFTKVELVEVSDLKDFNEYTSFSVVFLAPVDAPANPNTVNITSEELGDFKIFISPFSKDDKGVSFESVFSRLNT